MKDGLIFAFYSAHPLIRQQHNLLNNIETAVNNKTPIAVATTFKAGEKANKFLVLEDRTITAVAGAAFDTISPNVIETAINLLRNGAAAGIREDPGAEGAGCGGWGITPP